MMFQHIRKNSSFLAMVALTLGLGGGLLSSCKDNDDVYQPAQVTITPTPADNTIPFGVDGGASTLTIESNRPWSVQSSASWLAIDPASGSAGQHTITVRALPNATAARTTQITLIAGRTKASYTVSQEGKSEAPDVATHTTLAQFLAKHEGKTPVEAIAEEDVLEVTVLSDLEQKNQITPGLIQVQEGDTGLVVYLPKGSNPKVGEVIRIKTKGARLGKFVNKTTKKETGKIQLSNLKADMVELTGKIAPITPKVITLDDVFAGKYDNLLVAIDDLQFVNTKGNLYQLDKSSYFHRVTDCKDRPNVKSNLSVMVYKNATFGAEAIPVKRGRMVGILDIVRDDETNAIKYYNLLIRSTADLQLTGERCEGNAKKDDNKTEDPKKNEGSKEVQTEGATLIISAYVEATKGVEKYIQIYNPSDKEVELKDYVLKMDNFSKGASKGIKELALTGKLAPKAVITYRNTGAKLYTEATPDANVINFNGDDNVGLFYKGELVDLVGMPFGTEWKGGTAGGGADIVLQRKAAVLKPNKVYTETEWVKTPYDTFLAKDAQLSFLRNAPAAK